GAAEVHMRAAAVEAECLARLRRLERHVAGQRAVVASDGVIGIAVSRPVAFETGGQRAVRRGRADAAREHERGQHGSAQSRDCKRPFDSEWGYGNSIHGRALTLRAQYRSVWDACKADP